MLYENIYTYIDGGVNLLIKLMEFNYMTKTMTTTTTITMDWDEMRGKATFYFKSKQLYPFWTESHSINRYVKKNHLRIWGSFFCVDNFSYNFWKLSPKKWFIVLAWLKFDVGRRDLWKITLAFDVDIY